MLWIEQCVFFFVGLQEGVLPPCLHDQFIHLLFVT